MKVCPSPKSKHICMYVCSCMFAGDEVRKKCFQTFACTGVCVSVYAGNKVSLAAVADASP